MKTWKALIGVLICVAAAGIVFASVTFDPAHGTGFVGKGDVQLALGYNNAQMQKAASFIKFTYISTDKYEVTNAWATGNPENPVSVNSHIETVTTTVSVNAYVNYQNRTNPKSDVTGFNLTGFDTNSMVINGTIPVKSSTVTFISFTWTEQVWNGEWTQVPVYDNKGVLKGYKNGDKIYVTVTHTGDQIPVDENGNWYTEGNNKAVLSVTLLDSTGSLYVNDGFTNPVQNILIWPPVVIIPIIP